jgi:hypothetical protein
MRPSYKGELWNLKQRIREVLASPPKVSEDNPRARAVKRPSERLHEYLLQHHNGPFDDRSVGPVSILAESASMPRSGGGSAILAD